MAAKAEKYDVVQVDGLVLMKIIKHCKEALPELVTGQLLGLDVAKSLEVTNCFPFPSRSEDADVTEEEGEYYQRQSLACLREVNVDNNTVGWYMSTYLGSFIDSQTVETQFNYQENLKSAVCLVYDPMRTTHGNLFLKAYRLTDSFSALYKKQRASQEIRTDFTNRDIFEEVPIRISNPAIVNALLYEWQEDDSAFSCDFDRLDLSVNPFLEKNLECLIDCVDDGFEQNRKNRFRQNRRGRDDDDNPNRLETLLIHNQVDNYCEQIHKFAGQSFSKLFVMNSLHK